MSRELPVIGITMGDPAGIGPEIILKALSEAEIYELCRPAVYGDPGVLGDLPGSGRFRIREIAGPSEARGRMGEIDLVVVSRLGPGERIPGAPVIRGGEAMVACIIEAVKAALKGRLAAVVTCPISKALMHRSGHPFDGHTPLIAHLTGTRDYVMMLAGSRLRVALVTIHCPLKEVPALLDRDRIIRTIRITRGSLQRDFGMKNPRLAVAALNPHAGEEGLFGEEEANLIRPAVEGAASEGCTISGPLPADTLFYRAASGEFDAVISMYHDQGLIPLKLLHFSDAVNVTLGLPIVRTSVDHGTAYDIAGKGTADPASLKAAVRMAVLMSENRKRYSGTS